MAVLTAKEAFARTVECGKAIELARTGCTIALKMAAVLDMLEALRMGGVGVQLSPCGADHLPGVNRHPCERSTPCVKGRAAKSAGSYLTLARHTRAGDRAVAIFGRRPQR